jgi:ABC-2 type transport system ATP-binding protein
MRSLTSPAAPRPVPEPGTPLLALDGIRHVWRRSPAPILDGLTLTLAPGSVTWIGGRNGVGKTTLLRIAAGILVPQSGTVRLLGLDPVADREPFHRRLGFLSAGDRGLNARMSVAQQLDYWARLAYVPRARRAELVAAEIEAFALGELAGRRVDRMSMGQRQRVRLAMAFLHRPEVVLLDEPRNSLDGDGQEVLRERVMSAVGAGAAVVWCAPEGEEQAMRFDAGYVLEGGRLVREP